MPDEVLTDDAPDVATESDTADDKPLGPAGEKALAEWKQRAKAAEADAKRAKALEDELAQLREAQMSEHERAIEAARKEAAEQARSEVLSVANERMFRSELRAATAGKLIDDDLLSDPAVAMRLLGLEEVPVTNAGEIDSEAISTAVAAFLEAKPHLQASATRAGDINQGPRQTPKPQGIDEQIVTAEREGNWRAAMALKTQKLAALPRP